MKTCLITTMLVVFSSLQPTIVKIGDKVPIVSNNAVLFYNEPTIDLPDLNNDKIVILDFWSTWCRSCIRSFPRLDTLQKLHPDKVQIIPVTKQRAETIEAFWMANEVTQGVSLPTIVGDTTLSVMFPYQGVPHIVWIDRAGRFRGSSKANQINEQNILELYYDGTASWLTEQ